MVKITRYNLENYCHFVTTKTFQNSKIFSNDKAAELLIQTIFEVKEKLKFRLTAFAVMLDHLHFLMLVPDKRNTISDVMRHIKGRFARKYNQVSRGINSPDYGVQDHRAGNSSPLHKSDTHRAGNLSLPESRVWQESFYDHVIRNEKEFVERLNYIYYNPVKAELVDKPEDYKYSSATRKYETDLLRYVGG
jgi:putative transposase